MKSERPAKLCGMQVWCSMKVIINDNKITIFFVNPLCLIHACKYDWSICIPESADERLARLTFEDWSTLEQGMHTVVEDKEIILK